MNKHDVLFFTLFPYHASTCFGLIFSPSSGGQLYNVEIVLDLLVTLYTWSPIDGVKMSPKHVEAW
jgi:hypothetical protein